MGLGITVWVYGLGFGFRVYGLGLGVTVWVYGLGFMFIVLLVITNFYAKNLYNI